MLRLRKGGRIKRVEEGASGAWQAELSLSLCFRNVHRAPQSFMPAAAREKRRAPGE